MRFEKKLLKDAIEKIPKEVGAKKLDRYSEKLEKGEHLIDVNFAFTVEFSKFFQRVCDYTHGIFIARFGTHKVDYSRKGNQATLIVNNRKIKITGKNIWRYFRMYLHTCGLINIRCKHKKIDPEYVKVEVKAKTKYLYLPESCTLDIFFGAWRIPLGISPGLVIVGIQSTLANFIAGWVGVLLAIVVTAGFIPDMLQKGRIELLLSKPIGRTSLLIYKYFGGLTFIFLIGGVLVVGSWLALSINSGFWNFAYLLSIFVLVFFFAVIYSVSTLFGVLTRSPVISVLMSIVVWFISFCVHGIKEVLQDIGVENQTATTLLNIGYFILPKTSEIKQVNSYLLFRATFPEEILNAVGINAQFQTLSFEYIILTSLGFTGVMLALSCFIFSRKDY
jgi:ABC-type transport system involved in multi-copper enzyme maturation permease subunit